MHESSAALLTAIVTATPEIAALVGPDGDVTWINPAFVTRWPCAGAPTVNGLLDVVHPDDHAVVEEAWGKSGPGCTALSYAGPGSVAPTYDDPAACG